jgi:hypothetical protein
MARPAHPANIGMRFGDVSRESFDFSTRVRSRDFPSKGINLG